MAKLMITREQIKKVRNSETRSVLISALGSNDSISFADAAATRLETEALVDLVVSLARKDPAVLLSLRLWMADCADHVLPICAPGSEEGHLAKAAIKAARAFARSEVSKRAAMAEWRAAWEATSTSPRANGQASREAAVTGALVAFEIGQARLNTDQILSAVQSAFLAVTWAASDGQTAWGAVQEEGRWQRARLVAWLSA